MLLACLRRVSPDLDSDALLRQRDLALDWAEKSGGTILLPPFHGLPLLAEMPSPPRVLFARGNVDRLGEPSLAVVGTRRASRYGLRAAAAIAADLARVGWGVVSGLAKGVDAAAHAGALAGNGFTAAVLAHGLDRVYPRENAPLAARVLDEGGCLLSEYPPGVAPERWRFPERNRIVSALARGAVVIEAGEKSGSLITARAALEQNREVFVIPGAFDDPAFSGSHRLLQQGAKLVTGIDDILGELPACLRRARGGASWLETCFAASGGVASLDELSGAKGMASAVREIENAIDQGTCLEIEPRVYAWIGPQAEPLAKS